MKLLLFRVAPISAPLGSMRLRRLYILPYLSIAYGFCELLVHYVTSSKIKDLGF